MMNQRGIGHHAPNPSTNWTQGDEQVDHKEEQGRQRRHRENAERRRHQLLAGGPGHLGQFLPHLANELGRQVFAIVNAHYFLLIGSAAFGGGRRADGRSGGARILNPRFWRPVLYQLSYTPRRPSARTARTKTGSCRGPPPGRRP